MNTIADSGFFCIAFLGGVLPILGNGVSENRYHLLFLNL